MRGPGSLLTLGIGVGLGALAFGLVRLALLPPIEPVHYHANWALWIDGKRVDLSADRYMEDVAACSADASNIAAPQRVHMHENNDEVVHVHHSGATWGHLFQNLGWALGADWIYTDDGELHRAGDARDLTFVLNGLVVPPAHNRVIQPGDRLLISMGSESPESLVRDRYPTVATDAPEFDEGFDPAGCQGNAQETFGQRLGRAFWF